MSELMIRQVLPRGQKPVYGFVDLGVKENMSRGQSSHVLQRDVGTEAVMFITFLPDTLHNRASLLAKNSTKGALEIYFQQGDEFLPLAQDWVERVFGKLKGSELSAPAPKKSKGGLPGKAPAPAASTAPQTSQEPAKGAPEAPKGKINAVEAAASLGKFLDLPFRDQMIELDTPEVPEEFLKALVASQDPRMKSEVQEKAFALLSAMG